MKKLALYLLGSIAFVSPLVAGPELPAQIVELKTAAGYVSIGTRMEILEDASHALGLEDVLSPGHAARFRRSEREIPNFGFTESVYWVRFAVRNVSDRGEWILQVNYPPLDNADIYIPAGDGVWKLHHIGDLRPFGARELPHASYLVPLRLDRETRVFYMRFQTQGAQQFPLYLTSPESLRLQDREEVFAFGMYYGIILVLALYNLILFFIVRDRSFLYYLLYVTGYGLIQLILNGLAYEHLWPNSPWWANRSLPFSIGWAFFWSLQFARSFLGTRQTTPVLDRFMIGLMVLFGLLMLSSLLVNYRFNINFSAILVNIFAVIVLIVSVLCWRRGVRPARYFLIAWLALLIGISVYASKGLGLVPANFITEYGLQIGSAVEMALLSIGLGDRINVMNLEKEEAKRGELEIKRLHQEAQLHSARLELELLKNNIQPHFLMNSINATIVWLQDDPQSASRLLNALADELRLLLDMSSKKLISLEEELRLCSAHLEVMSLRHDKKFTLRTEGLRGDEIISPLVIHTLIENGLTHGFHLRDEGEFTLQRVESGDGALRLRLSNNGEGKSASKQKGTGTGLKYVRTRLEEAFPGRWKLESGPLPDDAGWAVELEIRA